MPIIGIDLGTTNSLAAYFAGDEPKIIENSYGERLTPSVVSIDEDGEIFVGKIARERLITHPDMTVSVFKRNMGSKKEYKIGGKSFLPEELSSLIIKKLKEDAEVFFGEPVTEAIISVPAYFNDAQRRATKQAGELAGLKVERIINEPTAAAIAYGLHEKADYTKYLVFDLGGGTFDVSILELYKNVMEVRAVAGNNYLGGEDFTDILVNMFIAKFKLDIDDLSQRELGIIRKSAEVCKREFSNNKNVKMSCVLNDETMEMDVTLDNYEKQCELILQKIKKPIIRALSDASVKLSEIDTILLVGGATKLPVIRNFVSKLFGRLPFCSVNPDEVVALGTAVQAALKTRNEVIKEIVLTDVCPYTLGTSVSIEKMEGYFQSGNFLPIIERNTIIPVSRTERLYTLYDRQKMIRVEILQGENRKSSENIFLGELAVPVPPAPAGKESVDVRYTYDINGILEVEVTVLSTNVKKSIIIEENPGYLTEEEIKNRLEELQSLKIHPREKDEYKYLLARGERLYEESIGDTRRYLATVLGRFDDILDKQDDKLIEEYCKELKMILDDIEQSVDF